MESNQNAPLLVAEQGSFAAGGTTVTAQGECDFWHPTDPVGGTLHGDHAYAQYQVPAAKTGAPLVFLHGACQSGRTWETTPDGRIGFAERMLRFGHPTYVLDQPRRGRAAHSTADASIPARTDEQLWFHNFRLGQWPKVYEDNAFPSDPAAVDAFFRTIVPDVDPYDPKVISDGVAAVFEKIGPAVLVDHLQAGGTGWLVAMKTANVAGIVAYEPFSGYVFPKGEVPEPITSASPFGACTGVGISAEEFEKLCKIPIVVYYGDGIAHEPTDLWPADHWRSAVTMARKWADCVNAHGGDAQVVELPDIGIKGNTHFMFYDENADEVAAALEDWLESKGLARISSDVPPQLSAFPVGEPNTRNAQYFSGRSWLATLTTEQVPLFNVTFEPGCRNNWHIHHANSGGGQMLVCVGGHGWYQEEGKPARALMPGDVVNIPAGVKHWHGAASDSWFSHLALSVPGEEAHVEWLEPVSDEDYAQLG